MMAALILNERNTTHDHSTWAIRGQAQGAIQPNKNAWGRGKRTVFFGGRFNSYRTGRHSWRSVMCFSP